MNDLTPAALQWLADHHGVITSAVLRSASVGRSTTHRLLRAAVLRGVFRGVYVLTASKPTIEQRCALLSAAHPSWFVTGPTAGASTSCAECRERQRCTTPAVTACTCRRQVGAIVRQTRALAPSDRWLRPDGIAVATPHRLGFDLAADLLPLDHLSVLQQLLEHGLVTMSELTATGQRLCHPARPGSRRFIESLNRLDGVTPADSHPEVVLAEALRHRAVPVEQQARVLRGSVAGLVHIDLAVPAIEWGIELRHPSRAPQHRGACR